MHINVATKQPSEYGPLCDAPLKPTHANCMDEARFDRTVPAGVAVSLSHQNCLDEENQSNITRPCYRRAAGAHTIRSTSEDRPFETQLTPRQQTLAVATRPVRNWQKMLCQLTDWARCREGRLSVTAIGGGRRGE